MTQGVAKSLTRSDCANLLGANYLMFAVKIPRSIGRDAEGGPDHY